MKAAIYCRVSTDAQEKEGTSLQTQYKNCFDYCQRKGYQVPYYFSEIYSGLSIKRPELDKLRELARAKAIDVVVIHSLDRLTRDPVHGVIITEELKKYNVIFEAVTEDVNNSELGKLISYIRGFASKLEVDKIRERTMRGKMACAKQGRIPAGFGRYNGYLGLKYDLKRKILVHIPGEIEIAAEILDQTIRNGLSSSKITRILQTKGIKGKAGGYIHRSSVSRVLHNARVYAGLVEWNGIEIPGKVESPIITIEQANIVAERLRLNKANSLGFGKKKWLSGRIFCECGRRYNLDSKKGCYCNGADKRNPAICQSPRVNLNELSSIAYGAMILALSDPSYIFQQAEENHNEWQQRKDMLEQLGHSTKQQQGMLENRRRSLSFQHENGGLTDAEYIKRLEQIKKEEDEIVNYDEFMEPEPPKLRDIEATFKQFGIYRKLCEESKEVLKDPQSEFARNLAEKFDLKLIIGQPVHEGQHFSVRVKMNMPIDEEELDECDFLTHGNFEEMVFNSTVCYKHHSHLPIVFSLGLDNQIESLLVGKVSHAR